MATPGLSYVEMVCRWPHPDKLVALPPRLACVAWPLPLFCTYTDDRHSPCVLSLAHSPRCACAAQGGGCAPRHAALSGRSDPRPTLTHRAPPHVPQLEKMAEESKVEPFVCHFYNHYFAHTAGGLMIGKR